MERERPMCKNSKKNSIPFFSGFSFSFILSFSFSLCVTRKKKTDNTFYLNKRNEGWDDYMSIFDVKNLFAAFRNFSLTDVRFYIIKGLNIKIIVDLFISILISCLSTNSY